MCVACDIGLTARSHVPRDSLRSDAKSQQLFRPTVRLVTVTGGSQHYVFLRRIGEQHTHKIVAKLALDGLDCMFQ